MTKEEYADRCLALAEEYKNSQLPTPPPSLVIGDGIGINSVVNSNPLLTNFSVDGSRSEVTRLSRLLNLNFNLNAQLRGISNECLIIPSSNVVINGGKFLPGSSATGSTPIEIGEYGSLLPPIDVILNEFNIDGEFTTAHGIGLHGSAVLNGFTIKNIAEAGREVHGIWINDSRGNIVITNFDIQASSSGIFCGGSVFNLGQVPKGIYIARGKISKPLNWQDRITNYNIKNFLECKGGEDILIEDLELDGNWRQGQDGDCILLKAESQYGRENFLVHVTNVILRRIKVTNSSGGISIGGPNPNIDKDSAGNVIRTRPNGGTNYITIDHCELNIDKNIVGWSNVQGSGRALQIHAPVRGIRVLDSIFNCNGSSWGYVTGTGVCEEAEFRRTTVNHGTYGLSADGIQRGNVVAVLNAKFPGAVWEDMTVNIRRKSDNTLPYHNYPPGTNIVILPYEPPPPPVED